MLIREFKPPELPPSDFKVTEDVLITIPFCFPRCSHVTAISKDDHNLDLSRCYKLVDNDDKQSFVCANNYYTFCIHDLKDARMAATKVFRDLTPEQNDFMVRAICKAASRMDLAELMEAQLSI